MKQTLYTLMVICAFGLLSCRKSGADITITQYDADQIQQYIKANNLTGMIHDAGDTSGIYYQIINPGTGGATIDYPTQVPYVFTSKSLDGKYSATDTILNHGYTYAAYIAPKGLQLAIKNIAKRFGAKIRVLIPSRLMYGVNGTTLSSYNSAGTVVYNTVGGNQSFDYTISIMNNQATYDDLSIQKYLAANGLTGQYNKTANGVYYRVTQPGTGTDLITMDSQVGVDYTGTLLNGIIFDQQNVTDGSAAYTFLGLYDPIPAMQEVLQIKNANITAGAKLSFITPSGLAYGQSANAGGAFTIPGFSCLRFDMNIVTVTN